MGFEVKAWFIHKSIETSLSMSPEFKPQALEHQEVMKTSTWACKHLSLGWSCSG